MSGSADASLGTKPSWCSLIKPGAGVVGPRRTWHVRPRGSGRGEERAGGGGDDPPRLRGAAIRGDRRVMDPREHAASRGEGSSTSREARAAGRPPPGSAARGRPPRFRSIRPSPARRRRARSRRAASRGNRFTRSCRTRAFPTRASPRAPQRDGARRRTVDVEAQLTPRWIAIRRAMAAGSAHSMCGCQEQREPEGVGYRQLRRARRDLHDAGRAGSAARRRRSRSRQAPPGAGGRAESPRDFTARHGELRDQRASRSSGRPASRWSRAA